MSIKQGCALAASPHPGAGVRTHGHMLEQTTMAAHRACSRTGAWDSWRGGAHLLPVPHQGDVWEHVQVELITLQANTRQAKGVFHTHVHWASTEIAMLV